ncbi:MAG: tautomerase family protein [Deltaproteobacteria bacterium]|nr:MAG: tautomerase family protein [Deltaproteobacteria bacterium]TMB30796.1 MAG: tautomerase family protein [Deltaproteobacteria bacterium]TMB32118.1 MAG: tautomerase family protein [Deltaproteobacteria bacterium]
MPLVRVSVRAGKGKEHLAAIGESIHQSLMETINVPAGDRFQIFTEHEKGTLVIDPAYLGIQRSDEAILVQITISLGRTLEMKKALFARIAERLAKSPGLRKEDVFVNLVEVTKENWSFGNGIAQYAGK